MDSQSYHVMGFLTGVDDHLYQGYLFDTMINASHIYMTVLPKSYKTTLLALIIDQYKAVKV